MPTTALFVMDFQSLIRSRIPDIKSFDAAASRAAELLAVARELGKDKVLIVHVIAGGSFRANDELYSVNKESLIGKLLSSFPASPADPQIVEAVAPLPDEHLLSRPRASPFHDTTLNTYLRSHNITKLLLTGVATSGVVLASFRSAVDADYDVAVVPEACADVDPGLHDALVGYFGSPLSCGRVVGVEEAKKDMRGA